MGLKKRTKVSAEFSMSSLTDIIFLLLIFFMLTSGLVSPTAINLKLPSSSQNPTNKASNEPITLAISQDKIYTIAGKKVEESAVENRMSQLINNDGRKPEEITIILSIHEDVDAQTLVTNVDMLNNFGVKMILATKVSS